MTTIPSDIATVIQETLKDGAKICFLTGAGLSVESGLKTFRGKNGYWTIGSDVYTPQEMATNRLYQEKPKEVWRWYLERFLSYLQAQPNSAHEAITELQNTYSGQIELVTQNIDGLHRRAGSHENIYEIHGDMFFLRCSHDPSPLMPLPESLLPLILEKKYNDIWPLLKCPICQEDFMRPHVLWFDESYNEAYYQVDSAWEASENSNVLIAIGTTGTTNIPLQIIDHHLRRNNPVLLIDPYRSDLTDLVSQSPSGLWLQCSAIDGMNELLKII